VRTRGKYQSRPRYPRPAERENVDLDISLAKHRARAVVPEVDKQKICSQISISKPVGKSLLARRSARTFPQ